MVNFLSPVEFTDAMRSKSCDPFFRNRPLKRPRDAIITKDSVHAHGPRYMRECMRTIKEGATLIFVFLFFCKLLKGKNKTLLLWGLCYTFLTDFAYHQIVFLNE